MPKVETFNRIEVIESATKTFHEKGYNGTTMQDLVDSTGLNRSSIYNSFGSKLDLFLVCLHSYQEKNEKTISKLALNTDSGMQAIKNIFEGIILMGSKSRTIKGCLIANCKSEMAFQNKSITNFLLLNQQNTLSLFEELVEKGQLDGSINTKKSKQDYGLYIFSSLQGIRMSGILINEKRKLQSVINTTLQILN